MGRTHEVTNQPPPLVDHDAAATDPALVEAVRRTAGVDAAAALSGLGRRITSAEVQQWAVEANTHPPVLRTHDRYGHRVDEVDFHPAWHRLMELSVGHGLQAAVWADPGPYPHLRRAAGFHLVSQVEAGHGCPISMTYAVLPALRHAAPEVVARYEPGLTGTHYDPGLRDPAAKRGLVAGMGMTEKQGGSDVRANTTTAVASPDGSWRLTGHKWFCSAPMSDLFLVLAQVPGVGLSCFVVPRVLPGGERNTFRLQRLKDKLGNRSNASAEVEFDDTVGWLVGEQGRGVRSIIEMVTMTRLDCVIGSAAGQRAALVQAVHHARHRSAFGRPLVEQPLMRSVLTDLAVESEAATALAMRLATAIDQSESALARVAVAAGKFWVCKRSPAVIGEALECLGGNGYVEDSGLPRLFRESPLNSIWEGSGNVIALDVLRSVGDPAVVAALQEELAAATGTDRHYDRVVADLPAMISSADQAGARRVAATVGTALQASLLIKHAPAPVADLFCATRLGGDSGHTLGVLPAGVDTDAVLHRVLPE